MLDALLFALVAFLLTAAGRQVVEWMNPSPRFAGVSPEGEKKNNPSPPFRGAGGFPLSILERNLLGYGIGLGCFGYGMLAIGLAGLLTPAASLLVLAPFLLLSVPQLPTMVRELRQLQRPRISWLGWILTITFTLFAVTSLASVYSPPTQLEWDALAYHLADPKVFIAHHRIVSLPWESHAEFAFNTEMWYTFGLLNGGVPLAKWFHFSCGLGAALTTYAFGKRFFSHAVGIVAALIFVSTPLVFWEAGAAYADLATTFFTALTGLAAALMLTAHSFVRQDDWPQATQTGNSLPGTTGNSLPGLILPALLMGFTLATKATALTTLGLLFCVIVFTLARQVNPAKALTTALAWAALAIVIGSPYFIKSAVQTGNPVYPFYFQVFGGRGWSLDRAQAYDASNAAFGQGRRPVDFLLLPYNLTMALTPNRPLPARSDAPLKQSFNDRQNILWTLSPVLLMSLFFPVFATARTKNRPAPSEVPPAPPKSIVDGGAGLGLTPPELGVGGPLTALSLYALGAVMLWFLTAQHVRYLLPTLPALCLLAAWAIVQAWQNGAVSGKVLAGFGVVSVGCSLAIAALLIFAQGPVALGLQSKQHYLTANVPDYAAMQFLNTQTPNNAKVVMYGNPFGFYLNRSYFWGDAQHSAFVPYQSFHAPADFLRWLKGQGVTYVLVNQLYFRPAPGSGDTGAVFGLLPLCGPPVFNAHGVEVYKLP